MTDQEFILRNKLYEYEDQYFRDMILQEGVLKDTAEFALEWSGDLCYHVGIDCISDVKVAALEDTFVGQYDAEKRILTITPDSINDPTVILHEMTHFYCHQLEKINPSLNEILLLDLYKRLSKEIDNLDELIASHAELYTLEKLEMRGGLHTVLFYLKTLDIDLKCGYKLGTVFGYGYAD